MGISRQRPSRPRGFTLLELIVANVVAVILLGAIAVTLRTVNASQQRSRAAPSSANTARESIVALVRNDLTNSRRIWFYPDGSGVALSGYAGISPATFLPTGELCRVYYRVVNGVLVRIQESLDQSAARPAWNEVVCSNISAFRLIPIQDRDALPTAQDLRGGLPLPARVALTVQSRDPGLALSEEVWLR